MLKALGTALAPVRNSLLNLALTYGPGWVMSPIYTRSLQSVALDAFRFTPEEYGDICATYSGYVEHRLPVPVHYEGAPEGVCCGDGLVVR